MEQWARPRPRRKPAARNRGQQGTAPLPNRCRCQARRGSSGGAAAATDQVRRTHVAGDTSTSRRAATAAFIPRLPAGFSPSNRAPVWNAAGRPPPSISLLYSLPLRACVVLRCTPARRH